MPTPPDPADEAGFLARWARRKAQARSGQPPDEPFTQAPTRPPVAPAVAKPAAAGATATVAPVDTAPTAPVDHALPAPTLDDVAALTPESSFARFVQQGVAAPVRNAALKKLFSDPHFNVMDGLDIYIDDYGLPDPLSPELLAQMSGNQFLGFAPQRSEEEAAIDGAPAAPSSPPEAPHAADSATDAAPGTDGAPPPHPEPKPPDEDPDLRLQPDAAPGRTGLAPGPGQDAGSEHRGT